MKNYTVAIVEKARAKNLIVKNHYSHKWSSCRFALGLFDMDKHGEDLLDLGRLGGVAVDGFPVGRQTVKSITSDMNNNEVLELTRLWLEDAEPKNAESY